jgi:hypothetical protein
MLSLVYDYIDVTQFVYDYIDVTQFVYDYIDVTQFGNYMFSVLLCCVFKIFPNFS